MLVQSVLWDSPLTSPLHVTSSVRYSWVGTGGRTGHHCINGDLSPEKKSHISHWKLQIINHLLLLGKSVPYFLLCYWYFCKVSISNLSLGPTKSKAPHHRPSVSPAGSELFRAPLWHWWGAGAGEDTHTCSQTVLQEPGGPEGEIQGARGLCD